MCEGEIVVVTGENGRCRDTVPAYQVSESSGKDPFNTNSVQVDDELQIE